MRSDAFAWHFANHCMKGAKQANKELRKMMKYQITWQGNAISWMKSFGKLNCSLCMRETIEILQAQQQEEYHLINCSSKKFDVCRHKMKFHRFLKEYKAMKSTCTSTDEGDKPERVNNRRGQGDQKKLLGQCAFVTLSFLQVMSTSACQFLYAYDLAIASQPLLLLKLVSIFAVSMMF